MGRPTLARCKKNARRRRAWIVFQDESGISERPAVRRTWAPRGETPILVHAFNWKKLSVAAAVAYRWDGRCARLFAQMKSGSYESASLIGFLGELKQEYRGKRVILVWDGLPAHKSRPVQEYLRGQRAWLSEQRLPGYAPELNPVESVWESIKAQELANFCAEDLGEAAVACRKGLGRVRRSSSLLFSFLRHAGLSL